MKKQIWEKYRYEFMRRDPEYINAWQEVIKLRKKAKYAPEFKEETTFADGVKTCIYPYWDTPEGQKERAYCDEFNITRMIDPAISYDKLSEWQKIHLIRFADFKDKAVIRRRKLALDKSILHEILIIEVNFTKFNSKDALKKEVIRIIDEECNKYSNINSTIKLNESNLDNVLLIGDFKKNNPNLSWMQIGKKVYSKINNGEDTIRVKATNANKLYHEMINGGWRRLKYP